MTNPTTERMATALQQAVAMYFLMIDHAKGKTDLTEDQMFNVVEGVCVEAGAALEEARDAGLLPPLPEARPYVRAHGDPLPVAHRTVM